MPFNFKRTNKCFSVKELLEDATNIYRTNDYIVKQRISISNVMDGNTVMMSEDVYFLRTPARDKLFEKLFVPMRKNINGKRIATSIQTRHYVE